MIRTFVFDLGNVILNFSYERMCQQVGDLYQRPPADIARQVLESGLFPEFERGKLTPAEFRQRLQQQFDVDVHPRRLATAVSDIFTPNEPLINVIRQLKRDGYRLVLLSNTNIMHYRFVRKKYDILDAFDACVLSYEVGELKPSPLIFERLLEELKCDPWASFYTDDIEANIVAARQFSINAEVFIDTRSLLGYLLQHNIALKDIPGNR